MDTILGEVTIRQRREKLEEMTLGDGLNDVYTATLTRLKAQKGYKSVLGLKVLMWVLYSERPLRTQELCHALGVRIGSADLDPENIPALRTVLSSCLGLVTVEGSSSTIRLVHFTLQEHLSRDPTLFHTPHSTIAEVCLTYLNFGCIRDLSPILRSAPATTPLLEYASVYWGKHARGGMTENSKILALKLLDRFGEHISAQLLLFHYNQDRGGGPPFNGAGGPRGFSGLHGVVFLGIVEVVSTVLDMEEWDVNAYDCMGMTALTWGSGKGYEVVVKMLLERGDVNPNQLVANCGRTLLLWATESGQEEIVKMLLERRDVNPDQADTAYGQTPLSWAARNGHTGVVKILLERKDVNPDKGDTFYGKTPLSWAAESGREDVVRMLLERRDVNPDPADTFLGQTPLSRATGNRHSGVVKMLLEREDVNPNQLVATCGRTPLLWAAENGHSELVKILLERKDVNPDKGDTFYGKTPLSWAAENGQEEVVKMLLERGDVNPNQADTFFGQRPLWWAARNGHSGVAKMLLERGDVNPDQADTSYSRAPLSWAARYREEEVVKILLKRTDIRTATLENTNETPSSLDPSDGHYWAVPCPQERGNDNYTTPDHRAPTFLPPSAVYAKESMVEMQFRSQNHSTEIIGTNGQPAVLSASHGRPLRLSDHGHSISTSADIFRGYRRSI